MNKKNALTPDQGKHSEWIREKNRAKNLWVVAVFGFWITIAVLVVVYFLKDKLDLILMSIAVGMMILGVWLKTRYQLLLRKERNDSDHGEDNSAGL